MGDKTASFTLLKVRNFWGNFQFSEIKQFSSNFLLFFITGYILCIICTEYIVLHIYELHIATREHQFMWNSNLMNRILLVDVIFKGDYFPINRGERPLIEMYTHTEMWILNKSKSRSELVCILLIIYRIFVYTFSLFFIHTFFYICTCYVLRSKVEVLESQLRLL